jgi:hypothetical protein
MDYIHLVQTKGQWQENVNIVMNFCFIKFLHFSLLVEQLLASQEEWCSMSGCTSESES